MAYYNIEQCINDPLLKNVRDLFLNTGIHGGFVEYRLNDGFADSGVYIVASINDVKNWSFEHKSPADIQRKVEGDPYHFYPYEFAVKVTDEDPMVVMSKLSEYCKKAELLRVHFTLENAELPNRIKESDFLYIKDFFENSRDRKISHEMQAYSAEEARRKIRNLNKEYSKPVKYKNKEEEILGFMRKYKQVNMETVDEEDIRAFKDFLNTHYPELEYVISDKIVADSGLGVEKCGWNPYGEAVSGKIEYREIYSKAIDEAAIHSALNFVIVSKAINHATIDELSADGPVYCIQIPLKLINDFHNYCKGLNVKYTLDTGYYDKPDRDSIPILVNQKNGEVVDAILSEMCSTMSKEHYVPYHERCQYIDKMKEMENKKPRHFQRKLFEATR